MAKSKERFARLLTEGVYAIRSHEDKPISLIQEELGRHLGKQPSAVEYWRKGNIPSRYSDVKKLAEEIIRRTNLGSSWLEDLIGTAGYSSPEKRADKLITDLAKSHPKSAPDHLLEPLHSKVVGRDSQISRILSLLKQPDSPWIITIDGMGGMGKTALTSGVIQKCLEEKLFDTIVSITALGREYSHRRQEDIGALTFDALLDTIAGQLGDADASRLRGREKEERLQALLRSQRILVVVDNLEAAKDPQNELAQRLLPYLSPSKALLISRRRFAGELYTLRLTGLKTEDVRQFLSQESALRNMTRINTVEAKELENIAKTTGGSPLALKFVIGQVEYLPLETVLHHLRTVQPLRAEIDEDEYVNFYKFIFWHSRQLLSYESQKLLIAMANFAPGVGGMLDMISNVSDLRNNELIPSIDQLWNLSFLEVDESSSLQRIRYYLHALTQHFVLADIVQELQ